MQSPPVQCEQARHVAGYVAGELNNQILQDFEEHLNHCSSCSQQVSEAFQQTEVGRWKELIRETPQSAGMSPDTMSSSIRVTANDSEATNRYLKKQIAGEGGTGVVWEAWDTVMERTVAIKFLKPDCLRYHSTQRLLREAMALARLSHPHLAAVHEFTEIEGQPAIVMEYVPGPTLSKCLQGQPVAEQLALSLMIRITSAIGHAHQAGIIHRDLKPSNILLRAAAIDESPAISLRRLDVKVLDFGTARVTDRETMTHVGQILGTPGYMSPEQISGDSSRISERTDIYGLGAILYELLTGRPPFTAEDPVVTLSRIMETEPVRPRLLQPGLSREIELICLKCLSKVPKDRYASADDLLNDLQGLFDGRPIKARPISALTRGVRWSRRHRGLAALGLFAIISVLVIAAETVLFISTQRRLQHQATQNAERVTQQLRDAMQSMDQIIKIFTDPQTLRAPAGSIPVISSDNRKLLTVASRFYSEYINRAGNATTLPFEDLQAAITLCWIQQLLQPEASLTAELKRIRDSIETHRAAHNNELQFLNMESQTLEISARGYTKAGKLTESIDAYLKMAGISQKQADLMGTSHPAHPGRIRNKATMLINAAGLFSRQERHKEATDVIQQACACYEQLLQRNPPADDDAIQLTHYRFALVVELFSAGKKREAVETAEATLQFASQYEVQEAANKAQLQMRARKHEEFVRIEKPNLPVLLPPLVL